MTKRGWGRWTGLVLAMALAGCGSSSSSDGPPSAKAFCEEMARAGMQKYTHCSGQIIPPWVLADGGLGCPGFAEAQEAGRIEYHADDAEACLKAFEGMSCVEADQVYGKGLLLDFTGLPDSCRQAVEPKVEENGTCASILDYECMGGYCTMQSEEACVSGTGTCRTFVAEGGDCSSARCAPGLTCDGDVCVVEPARTILGLDGDCDVENTVCDDGLRCVEGSCVPRVAVGGDCEDGGECLEGLRCLDTCTAPVAAGQECAGGDCADGLYCGDGGVCVAQPKLGESCAEPTSGDWVICVDSFCDELATPTPVCAAYVEPGQVCQLHDDETRWMTMCGPGYLCQPVDLWATYEWGTCGRNYCPML